MANWWNEAEDDTFLENRRGHTRKGQTGWIAWLDNGHKRNVNCAFGKCVVEGDYPDGMVEIQTDEHLLRVPHGRLDYCPAAALTNLSTDIKIAGDQEIAAAQERMAVAIKNHQGEIDKISRVLLLDLVAVEQAKYRQYPDPKSKAIGEELPKIEQTHKRIK